MTCNKNCMSIDAIVDNKKDLPLSPPDSYTSRSPTLSPKSVYMVPPMIPDEGSSSSESTQYADHIKQEDGHQHHIHHNSMSPEERRHRNKLASAKYRAKKQAGMKFMTSKLSDLVSTNASLEQELAKVKQENAMLRTMYDRAMITKNTPSYQQQQYI